MAASWMAIWRASSPLACQNPHAGVVGDALAPVALDVELVGDRADDATTPRGLARSASSLYSAEDLRGLWGLSWSHRNHLSTFASRARSLVSAGHSSPRIRSRTADLESIHPPRRPTRRRIVSCPAGVSWPAAPGSAGGRGGRARRPGPSRSCGPTRGAPCGPRSPHVFGARRALWTCWRNRPDPSWLTALDDRRRAATRNRSVNSLVRLRMSNATAWRGAALTIRPSPEVLGPGVDVGLPGVQVAVEADDVEAFDGGADGEVDVGGRPRRCRRCRS
jgi:hypothetical protein